MKAENTIVWPPNYQVHVTSPDRCATCCNLFDEGIITCCIKYGWFSVNPEATCDDYLGVQDAT